MIISQSTINTYHDHLVSENKLKETIQEHMRYAKRFANFTGERELDEQLINEYRNYIDVFYTNYNGKNGCISYTNSFLKFIGEEELLMPYFEVKRTTLMLRTPPLTDEDIANLLNFVNDKAKGSDFDESYF